MNMQFYKMIDNNNSIVNSFIMWKQFLMNCHNTFLLLIKPKKKLQSLYLLFKEKNNNDQNFGTLKLVHLDYRASISL